jgi:hypothetical protein
VTDNKISFVLEPASVTSIDEALATIKRLLPILIDLTPEQRHALLKMGEKSESFVRKALEVATEDDSFLPRAFNVEEMKKDVDLYIALSPIFRAVRRLADSLDDTLLELGSEAYTSALVVYKSAKDNGKGQQLDSDLDEMGKKFARKSASVAPTPTPTPTPLQ